MSKTNLDLSNFKVSNGLKLSELVQSSPVALVFLRHFGCTYCKKTIDDFFKVYPTGKTPEGVQAVFVHMSSEETAAKHFQSLKQKEVLHIANPDQSLYKAFELKRGQWRQLFGPSVLKKGVKDVLKYGIGKLEGDGFQMPGLFLIDDQGVKKSYFYKDVSDSIDFKNFLSVEG